MRILNLAVATLLFSLAAPALATVKVYNATPPNGIPGDRLAYGTGTCPTVKVFPNSVEGHYELTDLGGGTASMTDFRLVSVVFTDIPDLTGVFGPGAFVFISSTPTTTISALPHAGSGSTAPGGSVAWGVLSGFSGTGFTFCIASPQTVCTGGAMVAHGTTVPVATGGSPTFDLGTWSFDAAVGNLTASPYVNRTSNGGTSNGQTLIRGAYVGAAIPALPLIGAGALAVCLLIAGTRSVMNKK